MNDQSDFLPFFQCFSHGLVFLLTDICIDIRILFSQQACDISGSYERMPGQAESAWDRLLGGCTKMVGWKVGEGGPRGGWRERLTHVSQGTPNGKI